MSNEASKDKIESQNEQENAVVQEPETSKAWIVYSMSAGLCYGIGNTIYGISCS